MNKAVGPFVRSPYNYDMNLAGDESGLLCLDKSLTVQSEKDSCDLNVLMQRYTVRGELPQLNMPPLQGDFTDTPTYQEALNLMVSANRSFMALPARVRNKFENDPGQFVAFMSDENNRDEIRQMGLWSPEAVTAWDQRQAAEKQRLEALQADGEAYRAEKKAPKRGSD